MSEPNIDVHDSMQQRLADLDKHFADEIRHPLVGDPRVAAFAKAGRFALHYDEQFRGEVESILDIREGEPPEYTFSRMLRSFSKALLTQTAQEKFDYPADFGLERWGNWLKAFDWTLNDPIYSEEFTYDMWSRELQSNISERYKTIKLLFQLLPDYFASRPTILDIGCSQNQGLKKLLLNRPFEYTRIVRGTIAHPELDRPDSAATRLVNKLLNSEIRFGACLGVDIEHAYDLQIKEWAKACSFLPSELLNERLICEYDYYDRQEVAGVGFLEADFLQQGLETFEEEPQGRHMFDYVFLSTIAYQLSEEGRQDMFEIAKRYRKLTDKTAGRGGLTVINDNASTDPDDASRLEFDHDFSKDYAYTTHINDPTGETEDFWEIFKWQSGRCMRLMAGRDLGRLAMVPGVNQSLLNCIDRRAD